MKLRVIIAGILLLPFFILMGGWIISDIVDELQNGHYLNILIPVVVVSAFVGCVLLSTIH